MAGEVNVAFASTAYGPMWAPAVSSWLRCVGYTARHFAIDHIGKIGGAGVTDRQYTHMAENQLVKDFLDDKSFTHLFMTEMDMVLPYYTIVKLMELDKDMASGVYFLRASRPEFLGKPCLYKRPAMLHVNKVEEGNPYAQSQVGLFPTTEPFRVDCSGVGCVLIKRNVLETLQYPWFDLSATKYGSDMYFYKHAADAGFELWAHPGVLCGQVDYYETTIDDWKWQMDNNPDFFKQGFIIGFGEKEGRVFDGHTLKT